MSQQRVALVSGANRGIGRARARQLSSEHGFLVLAGARDPHRLDLDGSVVAVALDVTDAASVDAAFSSIAANQGRLDVLVNNAGIEGPPDAAGQVDLAEVQAVLETNLFGAWRLVQAALPLMRRRSDAHIVNISSGMGQLAEMGGRYSAHRISKAGLNALTRVVAAEEPGIRVNSICPGWVRTDMGGPSASRPVAQGADTAVWLASTDPPPTGGFFRDRKPIPW